MHNEVVIQTPRAENMLLVEIQAPAMQAVATSAAVSTAAPAAAAMAAPQAITKRQRRGFAKRIRAFLRFWFRAMKAVYTYIYEP